MVDIPDLGEGFLEMWRELLLLAKQTPSPWTLIGAHMVALHGWKAGRKQPRASKDADILVNARVVGWGTQKVSETLLSREWKDPPQGQEEVRGTHSKSPRSGGCPSFHEGDPPPHKGGIVPAYLAVRLRKDAVISRFRAFPRKLDPPSIPHAPRPCLSAAADTKDI